MTYLFPEGSNTPNRSDTKPAKFQFCLLGLLEDQSIYTCTLMMNTQTYMYKNKSCSLSLDLSIYLSTSPSIYLSMCRVIDLICSYSARHLEPLVPQFLPPMGPSTNIIYICIYICIFIFICIYLGPNKGHRNYYLRPRHIQYSYQWTHWGRRSEDEIIKERLNETAEELTAGALGVAGDGRQL